MNGLSGNRGAIYICRFRVTVENETCTIDCTVASWRAPGRPGARVNVSVTIDTLLSFLFASAAAAHSVSQNRFCTICSNMKVYGQFALYIYTSTRAPQLLYFVASAACLSDLIMCSR